VIFRCRYATGEDSKEIDDSFLFISDLLSFRRRAFSSRVDLTSTACFEDVRSGIVTLEADIALLMLQRFGIISKSDVLERTVSTEYGAEGKTNKGSEGFGMWSHGIDTVLNRQSS